MTREEAIQHLLKFAEDNKYMSDEIGFLSGLIKTALSNPWHKTSEELPKVDKYIKCIEVFARKGDDVFVAFYSPVAGFSLSSSFYTEYILSNIEYWMPIPELLKKD